MSTGKTFRHGQILRLVGDQRIANQEELRRRLADPQRPQIELDYIERLLKDF